MEYSFFYLNLESRLKFDFEVVVKNSYLFDVFTNHLLIVFGELLAHPIKECRHLKSMGALEMGLTKEELQPLVNSWRNSNPMITAFWWDIDRAVKTTILQRIQTEVRGIRFFYKSGMLFIKLPSGRLLSYVKPRIGENQYGGESVTYEGVGSTKKWERIESYGSKFVAFVENIVQAVSRDILCYAMKTLRHCFIVGHVHDELITECSPDVDLNVICMQMGRSTLCMRCSVSLRFIREILHE